MLLTFFLGMVFGALLLYARLNRFDVITGLALREDLTVAKALSLAIGTGAILVNAEVALGVASYHVKPLLLGGVILGGIVFGMAMAILGYCPGTLAVSAGEGSLDAVIGIAGGLTGGVFYTLVLPYIRPILGPDLGKISLRSALKSDTVFFPVVLLLGLGLILLSFFLDRLEGAKAKMWVISGLGLGVLDAILFLKSVSNRPIGASTTYPYIGDLLSGLTGSGYFARIKTPGAWEAVFLAGALLAGFILSLLNKEFRLIIIHENWKKHRGISKTGRAIWAFTGGFLLIFGARMAGGCTSGHILSGGMQFSASSWIFAVFVFSAFLAFGPVFYRKR